VTDNASQSRARWLLLLLALTAAIFLVVASACGGDDDDDDGGDNEATATESADGGDDGGDDSGDETPADGGDGDDDGDSGDAAADLAALAGDYEKFEGYVKYDAQNFGGADSGLSSMAIYQKGDSSRIDMESADGNVILITTPDATYMCTENQCLKYPSGEDTGGFADAFAGLIDPGTIESEFGDLGNDVDINVSKEKIAGLDATCYSATGDLDDTVPGDESSEVCFAEGGLLLRLTSDTGGESFTLEATEADTDVPNDAFEPPFEVVDLGDLGDLGQ
jgi:hypothetical protein